MTREWPYERFDITTGCTLRITRSADMNGHALVRTEGGATRVPAAALPAVAAALYEAAGLPAPVILERPEPRDVIAPSYDGGRELVTAEPDSTGAVTLAVHREGGAIRLPGDQPIRVAIALVDAMAEAESGPDPAEVEELAQILREHGDCASLRWDAARAVLRWMKQREADHG